MLDTSKKILTPPGVLKDIKVFIEKMRLEEVNVKQLGIIGKDKKKILDELEKIYINN